MIKIDRNHKRMAKSRAAFNRWLGVIFSDPTEATSWSDSQVRSASL